MPAVPSSWLIGSITIPAQNFTCNGNAAVVAAGSYYLRNAVSHSLIDAFNSAVENAMGGGGAGTIRRSRQAHLDIAPATTVVWGPSTLLRDLLGYTGDLASSTSHLAPNISPLLFSAGFPATPKTIPGVNGYTVPHQSRMKSDDGTQSHTVHFGSETWQDLTWSHIVASRMRVATGLGGGTFHQFYEQCAMLGARFFHYEDVVEDAADSATDIVWPTGRGPYVLRPEFDGDWYRRRIPSADISSPLELPLHVVAEYP